MNKLNRWVHCVIICLITTPLFAQSFQIPTKTTPRPVTTNSVPHIQLNVQPIPSLSSELLRRVALLPGVDVRKTVISLAGAQGFWLSENIALARPDAIVGGREFAHMHPDGSLHAALEPSTARKAIQAGWAISHPWAGSRPGWEGFVMIYTPRSQSELDMVYALVVDSYTFVTTGKSSLD